MKRLYWQQIAKAIVAATAGRLIAEMLIRRYRASFKAEDRRCPHIVAGKPLKLRIIINEDWHQFCAVCTDAYSSIFEMSNNTDKIVVVGIKNIGSLEHTAAPELEIVHAE